MRGVIKKVRYLRQIFLIHIKFLCCYPSDKPRRLLLSVACAEAPLGLKAWQLSDPCFTCSEHPASSPSSSPVYCCIYFPSTLQWCAWRCAGVAFAEAGVRMCCCCFSCLLRGQVPAWCPGCLNSAPRLQQTVRSKHLHRALHAPRTVQANTDRIPEGSRPSNLPRIMNRI